MILRFTLIFSVLWYQDFHSHFPNIDMGIRRTSYLAHWLVLSNIRRVFRLTARGSLAQSAEFMRASSWRRGINSSWGPGRKATRMIGSRVYIADQIERADRNFSRLINDRCEDKIRLVSFYEYAREFYGLGRRLSRYSPARKLPESSVELYVSPSTYSFYCSSAISDRDFRIYGGYFPGSSRFFPGTSSLPKKRATAEWRRSYVKPKISIILRIVGTKVWRLEKSLTVLLAVSIDFYGLARNFGITDEIYIFKMWF